MTPQYQKAQPECVVAQVINEECGIETTADLIDAMLSCSDNQSLSDEQVQAGERLFDSLCNLNPGAVCLAQGGITSVRTEGLTSIKICVASKWYELSLTDLHPILTDEKEIN